MKKTFLLSLLSFINVTFSFAQNVAINAEGSLPNSSAMLDVSSTTKGFLPPRMTLAQRNLIALPANGLIIYQTDEVTGLYVNKGTSAAPNWLLVGPAVSASPAFLFATDQSVSNNSYVGLGTSSTSFTRQTIVVPADCVLRSIAFSTRLLSPTFTATVWRQTAGGSAASTALSTTVIGGAFFPSSVGFSTVAVNAGDLISIQITGSSFALTNGVAVSVGYQ